MIVVVFITVVVVVLNVFIVGKTMFLVESLQTISAKFFFVFAFKLSGDSLRDLLGRTQSSSDRNILLLWDWQMFLRIWNRSTVFIQFELTQKATSAKHLFLLFVFFYFGDDKTEVEHFRKTS